MGPWSYDQAGGHERFGRLGVNAPLVANARQAQNARHRGPGEEDAMTLTTRSDVDDEAIDRRIERLLHLRLEYGLLPEEQAEYQLLIARRFQRRHGHG
jgi:hypothetical protein